MTWIFNRPSDFAKEMVAGFVSAHASLVRQVPGGVVRNTQSKAGSVAIVVGGGSGHYPAFAGLVGQGLAHGAAMAIFLPPLPPSKSAPWRAPPITAAASC